MRYLNLGIITVILCMVVISLSPLAVTAAVFDFTTSAKTAFDNQTAKADSATSSKLKNHYSDMLTLQRQDIDWDNKINTLHYRNEEAMLDARNQLKRIDDLKIAKLEADVLREKEKAKPLLSLYDSLNKQLSVAKSAKSKTIISFLNPQVEVAKVAAQVAKQQIRTKEEALKAAKSAKTTKTKQIRDMLSETDKVKARMNAVKGTNRNTKKLFSAETQTLNQAVKKGTASSTLSSFARLLTHLRLILEQKSKIYAYEQEIQTIIANTKTHMTRLSEST